MTDIDKNDEIVAKEVAGKQETVEKKPVIFDIDETGLYIIWC